MRRYPIIHNGSLNIALLDQQLRTITGYQGCSSHRQGIIIYGDEQVDLSAVREIVARHDAIAPSPAQAERAQRQRERDALVQRLASDDALTLAEIQRALQLIERILRAHALI